MNFRSSPDSIKRLQKDCERLAGDRYLQAEPTAIVQDAAAALEAYYLDMTKPQN